MAFSLTKILKGLRVYKENTLTPDNIDIVPNGSASTTTTIQSSQTGNVTLTLPNATDTLVGKATTDVLTNKSLSDATTAIVDSVDNTKQIAFDAAGTSGTKTTITGSQTVNRVLTLPDASDTLIGKATTDTLTNKTFDANGTGNSITNIENADIKTGANIDVAKLGTGVVDNTEFNYLNGVTGQLSGNAQSATLQNKTLDNTNTITVKDNLLTIQDGVDTTKQLQLELSGITTATVRTLTVPNASTTIVGTDATQTLTNKTLDNTNIVTFRDDRFTLQDSADTTKQAVFELSGLTTATTRTYTLPNSSSTLVDLATTQTITGTKTAQSFAITTNALDLQVGQIGFPSSQNASADANTLDDYEEGTFTPTYYGSSTAGTPTYVAQIGRYTKIGRMVEFELAVQVSAHTGTGNIRIGGLPFSNAGSVNTPFAIWSTNLTYSNQLIARSGSTTVIEPLTNATGVAVTDIALDTSCTINVSGCYHV